MKKVLVPIAVAALLSAAAVFPLDVSLVPKAGAGVAFHTGDSWQEILDTVDANNALKFIYSAGAFLDLGLIDGLAVQTGAAFSQVGGAWNYDVGFEVNGSTRFTLLEVPLLLRPRVAVGAGSMYAVLGPAGFILLGDIVGEEEGVETRTEPDNRLVWGAAAGLGYSFPALGGNALVELKYTRSFTGFIDDDDTRLNNFYLQLGYALPIVRAEQRLGVE
jgi:hypothetical protein